MMSKRLTLAAFLGLLGGSSVAQGGDPGALPRQDYATFYVPPQVYLVGPIASCGRVKLPPAVNSPCTYGCPTAILLVPGRYDPIPREGWELTGYTRLFESLYRFECVSHWVLGFIPIPVSFECIKDPQGENREAFVLSWECRPRALAEPAAGQPVAEE